MKICVFSPLLLFPSIRLPPIPSPLIPFSGLIRLPADVAHFLLLRRRVGRADLCVTDVASGTEPPGLDRLPTVPL